MSWESLDKSRIWHPFTQMRQWQIDDPLIIDRAEGFHLIDTAGRRYLDGHSSLWVNIHGHCHPALVQAIAEQVAKLDHSTLLGLGNTPSIALADRLVQLTPANLTRVFYSDSGSTAVEIAVKMAYQYWQLKGVPQRDTFLTFSGAYHGDTVGSVSIGAIDMFHSRFRGLLFPSVQCPWPRPYQDAMHGGDSTKVRDACLAELENKLAANPGRIAAVVAECHVQAADGMWVAPTGWMRGVEDLCRQYGALLIVDEVATGFCRTGKVFGSELEGIQPDLMALAKGITGGTLPLAVTMTSEAMYEAFLGEYAEFKHFFHGHTYTGNPIACAAALANLDLIDSSGLVQALPGRVAVLANLLKRFASHPHIGDIRQLGLMVGLEVVADRSKKSLFPSEALVPQRITHKARELGAIVRPLGNVMVLMPPPAMPEALLAELVDTVSAAIDAVTLGED